MENPLGIYAFRTGGTDDKPEVGINKTVYTPMFMASLSSQSGSPNASMYAEYRKQLTDNLDLGIGGSATFNEYGNFYSPSARLGYISQTMPPVNASVWSAGVQFQPAAPPRFSVEYTRRF